MRHELNLWVAGGDLRQAKLAELLAADGHTVHTWALEGHGPLTGVQMETDPAGVELADCLILPLPAEEEGGLLHAPLSDQPRKLEELLSPLRPGQLVCAGMVGPNLTALAAQKGLVLQDYFAREELAVANAVPTAEGAIQIALEELPITLHGARVLVIGFGRVGKALSRRLAGLGAKVSVAARKWADLALAESCGYCGEQTEHLAGWLCGYDLVVNTVPAPVLGLTELSDLKPGCLVIDLASKPGGVDFEGAARLGVKVIWALSLPGKVAPVTAGQCIQTTIYNILRELGV